MRRIGAFVGALFLAILSFGLVVGSAAAYPPIAPSLSVASGATTDTGIDVLIVNLEPGSNANIDWNLVSAAGFFSLARTATAGSTSVGVDADGSASANLSATTAGLYSVTGTGTDAAGEPWTQTVSVTVSGAPDEGDVDGDGDVSGDGDTSGDGTTASSGDLPKTGGENTALLLGVAAGALVIGGTAVVAARARRWGNSS